MRDAACTGADSDLFMSPGHGNGWDTAKRICAGCLVASECLEFALADPLLDQGVWGGHDADERRKFKKRRQHLARKGRR
jgi:WhiB family redox-sensing transcriptional regulator